MYFRESKKIGWKRYEKWRYKNKKELKGYIVSFQSFLVMIKEKQYIVSRKQHFISEINEVKMLFKNNRTDNIFLLSNYSRECFINRLFCGIKSHKELIIFHDLEIKKLRSWIGKESYNRKLKKQSIVKSRTQKGDNFWQVMAIINKVKKNEKKM